MSLYKDRSIKKFYIFNAGCIRRAIDAIHIQEYLEENNWKLTKHLKRADLIVIATCGVVRLNEINSLKAISIAEKKKKKNSQIVITGCLPKINPDEIGKIGKFIIVPTGNLELLDSTITAVKPISEVGAPDSIADNKDITNYLIARSFCRQYQFYKALFHRFSMNSMFLSASVYINRTIQYVKKVFSNAPQKKVVPYFNIRIAEGCMSNCAFCATKFATGRLRSRPVEKIIEDLKYGIGKKYKIFQLIAEDTGCYGLDIGTNFSELLEQIFAIEGDYQLVIIDCCPQWLVEQRQKIVPLIVKNQDKIKELFVPIQSGSDHILKRMRRNYIADDVKSVLKELRERAPSIAIRTSFLVGFPGETEKDFAETERFIPEIDFFEVTINRYEDRPGTEASNMPDKIPQKVIEQRALHLSKEMGCRILS
jgi:tRNA A37 methylthiotransferase MiaB